ncbi:MAG: hypothetical protein PHE50_01385 [Dehalococcoidales bacterium]|nr:hypothetical protein [Dehalococcoidales bacterium]
MNRLKPTLLLTLIVLLSLSLSPLFCYANSAEPPAAVIIVPNAPDDLEISLGPENIEGTRIDKAFESYYVFYTNPFKPAGNTFQVTTGGKTFYVTPDTRLRNYNSIYKLDLKRQTLTNGESISRSITLVSVRIILTLLIEGFLFFLFRYRTKRSWLVFLFVNLITQGFLNIWLDSTNTPIGYGATILLIFGEFIVFILEMITFLIFVNERHRLVTALYVILANILSLIAGGYLITRLPI